MSLSRGQSSPWASLVWRSSRNLVMASLRASSTSSAGLINSSRLRKAYGKSTPLSSSSSSEGLVSFELGVEEKKRREG
eukprot:CAMPEP_0185604072 /NCGR_PEP_ID=MMETSP0436-20130131/3015_1 /TAXON_ID=626734 ORGANISM="Favella taraikaensis, Strain Fe Narragansett Bay" /NCGR_SAMPLE_ID=MMETSP0436 /ASSEMBLY_ACC=CAM_ASM_000390 /LENGTH=77 /DNA_ID=CAMNT_0028234797 /DNA_START=685 /DNA_END=915 /DNA_ORIENTATION=-